MKRRATPLQVEAQAGTPCAVTWHGRRQAVTVLDRWRAAGHWWLGGETRRYFLVAMPTGIVLEIYESANAWTLSRVAD